MTPVLLLFVLLASVAVLGALTWATAAAVGALVWGTVSALYASGRLLARSVRRGLRRPADEGVAP
jgi:hypothetical protein